MRHSSNGFTLVELLIVIGIITLLISLTYPSLNRAKILAKRVVCQANLHAVGIAFRIYLDQNKEIMPIAAQMPSLNLGDGPRIADVLAPYLSPEALKCPADNEKNFFASEGSSYEYHSRLGGRKVTDSFLTKRWGEHKTHVMYDYETFHGPPGTPGAMNFLFADGHVGN